MFTEHGICMFSLNNPRKVYHSKEAQASNYSSSSAGSVRNVHFMPSNSYSLIHCFYSMFIRMMYRISHIIVYS